MGTTITCPNCSKEFDSKDGFLRPEGFLCGNCYREKCKDPAYVAEMERELTGLVSTLTAAIRTGAPGQSRRSEKTLIPTTPADRLACEALIGLSVGDALGARFEGEAFDVARLTASPLEPDGIASWTDDTQMALSVVECLLDSGAVDQDRLAAAFGRRYESWRGYWAGMHAILPQLREGKDWRELKDKVFFGGSFGNGSAMRVAPLGAYFHDAPVDTVVLQAERSAEVTHAHPEALAGAASVAVGAWLAARSRGRPAPPSDDLLAVVQAPLDASSRVARGIELARALTSDVRLEEAVARLGNGSKVTCADTVPLALWIASGRFSDRGSSRRRRRRRHGHVGGHRRGYRLRARRARCDPARMAANGGAFGRSPGLRVVRTNWDNSSRSPRIRS